MPQRNARFIVLEGLDGAGTTTQAAKLHGHCTQRGARSFLTNEPTSGPIGAFIRRLLTSKELAPDGTSYRPPESSMALLFAADRLAHSREIASHLAAGEIVVCDRYVFSSLAYQTLDASIKPQWVVEINRGCAIPDLTIFLDVPVKVCLERLSARVGAAAIYETKPLLEAVSKNYHELLPLYEANYGRVVRLDGTRSIEDVHAAICQLD
ncbi:MAG TPA: dTMP kinase [Candidatus Krumholzibacteria bacterium]|nr:dTMP kinase [Candidatus Krumholzibacteria bacterium]